MTVHVPRPVAGGHSLVELAVGSSGPERDAIEVGWRVSPVLEGDARPHLFVHRWRAGEPCSASCDFVPWSARWAPGDPVLVPDGAELALGVAVSTGRWWVWFDGEWLGYFEAGDWAGRLDIASTAQWFGEVFSPGPRVAGEMGNGRPGTDPEAARIASACLVLPGTWNCQSGLTLFPIATEPASYPLRLSGDELRYGGTR